MYKCPHCNKASISGWDKFSSNIAHPTMCSECGKNSYTEVTEILVGIMLVVFIVFPCWLMSVIFKTYVPLYLAIILFVLIKLLFLKLRPLVPANSQIVKTSKAAGAAFLIVSILFRF
jgi:cobalamin biosynthesis protein CobD/CbiB